MCPGPEGQNPSAPGRGRATAGTKVHAEKEDQLGVEEAMDVRHPRRLTSRPRADRNSDWAPGLPARGGEVER